MTEITIIRYISVTLPEPSERTKIRSADHYARATFLPGLYVYRKSRMLTFDFAMNSLLATNATDNGYISESVRF